MLENRELTQYQHLKWHPYIGTHFSRNDHRLLIVGESHYATETPEKSFQEDFALVNQPDFTQRMIAQTQLQRAYVHKPLENLEKALFGGLNFNQKKLWEQLAYYNFVQRVMDYRTQERPTIADFDQGWKAFVEVTKTLNPTDVIFIGVEAATSFERMMDQLKIKRSERKLLPEINGTQPRVASIWLNGAEIRLSFIKHSSAYFSPEAWSGFLRERHREVLEELKKKIV